MDSTRSVGAVALVALVVTSGCIGFVMGEEPLVYEANQAGVSDDAKQATGYERSSQEQLVVNRTVSDRDVTVTNWYARYEKYDDIAEETTGVFAVVSTHRVDVFGRTTNPYASMSNEQLLTNLTSNYDTEFGELSDPTFVENRTRTVLGQETTVGVFETTTRFGGEEVEVRLYVTRVQHGDDIVLALGGHPKKLPAGEQSIMTMIEGIEHSTDENETETSARVAPAALAPGVVGTTPAVSGTATVSGTHTVSGDA